MHVLFPCRCAMIWIFSACWRDWNFYFEGFSCVFFFFPVVILWAPFLSFFCHCGMLSSPPAPVSKRKASLCNELRRGNNECEWSEMGFIRGTVFESVRFVSLDTHHTKKINNQNRIRKKTVRLCTRQRQKPRFFPGFTTNFFQLICVLFLHSITFNCCVGFFFLSFSFSSAERIFNGQ